jgi:3',5'-cyclic AMP phosphodiesterase CpdA
MKHLIIGDLHGRDCWEDIDMKKYDKVVFLGDYVDSFTLPDDTIYNNLNNLIKLKMRDWNRLILLLGNHDVQYRYFPRYQIKGFRPSMQQRLTGLFYRYWGCFKMAYQCGDHIFTHAGITNAWYDDFLRSPVLSHIDPGKLDVAGIINTVAGMVNPMDRYLLYAEVSIAGCPAIWATGAPFGLTVKKLCLTCCTAITRLWGIPVYRSRKPSALQTDQLLISMYWIT